MKFIATHKLTVQKQSHVQFILWSESLPHIPVLGLVEGYHARGQLGSAGVVPLRRQLQVGVSAEQLVVDEMHVERLALRIQAVVVFLVVVRMLVD